MSKIINNTYRLYNNPFLLMPILVEFYKHYEGEDNKNILLSYLVFPLILNQLSRSFLLNSKPNSSIFTFTKKKNKEFLFGLPQQVDEYKDLTNISLQYAIDNGFLKIENNNIFFLDDKNIIIDDSTKELLKASSKLKNIFKDDLDVVSIFNILGLKKL